MSTDIQFAQDEKLAPSAPNAMVGVAAERAGQEVKVAMFRAMEYPRDQNASFQRIMQACRRKSLAERALYAFPRGAKTVRGPSIRLAEALLQAWGNANAGVVELSNENGESAMLAYAWDLETNTRIDKVFTVKHVRDTKEGSYKLTDQRDIYELCANNGARRLRACILGIIPGDVIDAAVDECMNTLRGDGSEPIADRVRAMVTAFAEIGVNQKMIEEKLGHNLDVTTEDELVTLRSIFQSIRDGMADVKAHFSPAKKKPAKRGRKKAAQSTADIVDNETESPLETEEEKDAAVAELQAAIEKKQAEEAAKKSDGELFKE